MTNFKRCATAVALVLGSSIPALAQELPDRVILAIEGTETGYRVPIEVAAELCGEIPADTLAAIAADVDVIYCSIAETVVAESAFDEDPYIERIEGLGNDNNVSEVQSTAAETDGEAESDTEGEGATDDATAGEGTEGDAAVEGEADAGADANADAGGETDGDAGADAGADAEADSEAGGETDADADAGAEADSSTGG